MDDFAKLGPSRLAAAVCEEPRLGDPAQACGTKSHEAHPRLTITSTSFEDR